MQQKREHTSDNTMRSCDGLSASLPSAAYDVNKEAGGVLEEEEEEEGAADVPTNTIVNKRELLTRPHWK